jgi:surfactin synthase thioesterase subunit
MSSTAKAAERAAPCPANVVLLQRSRGESCVFCIHGVDGGFGCYLQLAFELAANANTYAIAAADLQTKSFPPPTVSQMAVEYVDKIQMIQAAGPYRLVGWSSGGWIAFEMACELLRRGEQVAEVSILETHLLLRGPRYALPISARRDDLTLEQYKLRLMWWRLLCLNTRDDDEGSGIPESFWTLDHTAQARFVLEHARDTAIFAAGNALQAARKVDEIKYLYDLINRQWEAFLEYEAPFFPGSLNVCLAFAETDSASDSSERAQQVEEFWRARIGGELHMHRVVGGHFAPLRLPAVRTVADVIGKSFT